MSFTFLLLMAVGASVRLAISWVLRSRCGVTLSVPQGLATVLIVLSAMPDWLKIIPIPLPFSVVLGAVLPDFFLRRG